MTENPHETVESNNRNNEKVMIFLAVIDGKAPIVHPFNDENNRNVIVNGTRYIDLLNEVVCPTFCSSAIRKGTGVCRTVSRNTAQ